MMRDISQSLEGVIDETDNSMRERERGGREGDDNDVERLGV